MHRLYTFTLDQIKEGRNEKSFHLFSNVWATFGTKNIFWLFWSNFWATFWEISGNFLENFEQLVASYKRVGGGGEGWNMRLKTRAKVEWV